MKAIVKLGQRSVMKNRHASMFLVDMNVSVTVATVKRKRLINARVRLYMVDILTETSLYAIRLNVFQTLMNAALETGNVSKMPIAQIP